MQRILTFYIVRHIIFATALVLLVLLGIETFLELIGELSDIGTKQYGIAQALLYVPLRIPTDLYELFPIAGLLGSLIGLGWLASNSELMVMRASGMSIMRITGGVLIAAVMMLSVITVFGEWLAPKFEMKAERIKAIALHKNYGVSKLSGLWLHHANEFVHIEKVTTKQHQQGVTSFQFNKQNQLQQASYAKTGEAKDKQWNILNVSSTDLPPSTLFNSASANAKLTLKHSAKERQPISFEPTLLQVGDKDASHQSLVSLWKNIRYRTRAGLLVDRFEFAFWQRVFRPIVAIVMICLGVPFIFGSLRNVSMGTRVLIGIVFGFGFYTLNQFFGPFSLVYQFPPFWAATLPTILFSALCLYLLKRLH